MRRGIRITIVVVAVAIGLLVGVLLLGEATEPRYYLDGRRVTISQAGTEAFTKALLERRAEMKSLVFGVEGPSGIELLILPLGALLFGGFAAWATRSR